ncbi:MAG: hypothetical protein IJQ20_04705 [Paludibacteraceae bacterium]|nr:hypothetical protein [Paludibacteraceae bacterium]
MSQVSYQDPIQSASGKIFGKKSNISQRKLFGIYESTYCYQNKPDHWSDAQTLHRQKMGAASLYAKLLLQDPNFAAQATAYRLSLIRRASNPHSAADKHLRPYLRNQQMLTSLIYSRLSAALSTNAPTNSPSDASADTAFASSLLAGYARYTSARFLDRPAVLAQLTSEDIYLSLKSTFLNDFCK